MRVIRVSFYMIEEAAALVLAKDQTSLLCLICFKTPDPRHIKERLYSIRKPMNRSLIAIKAPLPYKISLCYKN